MPTLRQRLLIVILLLLSILVVGTAGYMAIEGWAVLDALYMTVITLTTVGFGETRPLSDAGRVFTLLLITLGVGFVTVAVSVGVEYTLSLAFGSQLRRRRMQRSIAALDKHIIICGYGRVGESAARSMQETGRPFVVVENDELQLVAAEQQNCLVLEGDATNDEVLQQAGIQRATGLLVCTGSDVTNLFVVLSARSLNSAIFIVARASEQGNERKMQRAGANTVVSPYRIGGRHMANSLIRPNVTEFLDVVTLDGGLELWLEEVVVRADSVLVGQTVIEADMRRRTGATLVALRQAADGRTVTPDGNNRLQPRDQLIVFGTRAQVAEVERLASERAPA